MDSAIKKIFGPDWELSPNYFCLQIHFFDIKMSQYKWVSLGDDGEWIRYVIRYVMFIQEALCGITKPNAKLRTYGLIKHNFGREDYLVQIRNTKHRQALSKFRLSNHKLMIEVGRHMKIPKEERVCEICNNGIEDEVHFLVKCKRYETLREPLFELCVGVRPQFRYYSDQEKFIFLMTSPFLMGNVSKFIVSSLEERDIFLDSKATLDCLVNKVSKLARQ